MAEVIRPKFDVVRGWAGGGSQGSAYDRTFDKVVDGSNSPLKVKQGTFVTLTATGAATPVTVLANAAAFLLYCVVEGNDASDSYSGDYLDKVVGITGSFEVLLSETMYTAGSYVVGGGVSLVAGKVKVADSSNVAVGYVTEFDAAAKYLKVAFSL